MRQASAARATTRRTYGSTSVSLIVVAAAIIGTLVHQSASSSAASFSEAPSPGAHRAVAQSVSSPAPSVSEVPRGDHVAATTGPDGAVSEEDGVLPDGVTAFDDGYPGLANLDPELLQALREATTDAAGDGIELHVNSGWRSPEYQNQLLREAVSKYGSAKAAARWVATPDTSAHVSGEAVDIGPFDATAWLSVHGARYGLCQIYRNESWHFELRSLAIDAGCPPTYADSAHDPRMRR
jgi:D-alanyl-D-alanine carboxypeptidase